MQATVAVIESRKQEPMEPINLTPRYSTNEIPGRCIKCLAEEKLFNCMRELLKEEEDSSDLQQKYKIIYNFLESSDLQKLCNETEKYLAEGKEVNLRIYLEAGQLKYELQVNEA